MKLVSKKKEILGLIQEMLNVRIAAQKMADYFYYFNFFKKIPKF